MKTHILVVEDEEKLARFIELELMHEGYEVSKAFDGRTALSMASEGKYDLILLDIMLPGLNGLEVLRRLKNSGSHSTEDGAFANAGAGVQDTPVILVTARDAVMDKVSGLDQGAVDYITKPFAIEELLARIRVALKLHSKREVYQRTSQGCDQSDVSGNGTDHGTFNSTASMREGSSVTDIASGQSASRINPEEGVYIWKNLELNEKKRTVTYEGHEINLTNREFLMLMTLLANQDIVLSRDTLLEKVCGYDYVGETNVVDVYIRFLRSKIDEVFGIKMIQTVRGVGYVIKSE